MEILLYTGIAAISTVIVWVGSGFLESASKKLSVYYELPEIVQGAIVVAIGSSFPELSTVVVSTLAHGEFELGVSAIVGSAIFNILLIPGISSLVGDSRMESNRDLVYKEAQFYMISVAVLLLTFSFGAIYNPIPSGEEELILGEVTRPLAIIPIVLYCLYLFIQYQDTMEYEADVKKENINIYSQWGFLVLSLIIILLGVEGLIRAAVRFGEISGAPSWLWGVTMVAAGTSIPDLFVSVQAARNDAAVTSLANVLGSNIFDLLICIPVGVLIAGTATINYSIAAPMMGVLTLATIFLFGFMRTHMILGYKEGLFLVFLYLIFVCWMTLESFAVVDLIPSLPPEVAG